MSSSESYTAFMMDKACGSLSPGLDLAADIHVAMNVDGYRCAMEWNVIGGALFELEPRTAMTTTRRRPRMPATHLNVDEILSTDFETLNWRSSFGGVGVARTGVANTHFMQLGPDQKTPAHGHSALEATVVLEGALDVNGIVYERGDLALGVPGDRHQPAAHGTERCICFVAQDKKPFWRFT
ncbi:MAG: cupin domain-containing protein [Pseudomonadota bacterium]